MNYGSLATNCFLKRVSPRLVTIIICLIATKSRGEHASYGHTVKIQRMIDYSGGALYGCPLFVIVLFG